ncbi:hypothetical protein ABB37_01293 [Leptomonas pyrrhocoris]|uniref:Uncharacterized protein n=1 Tax=Leptomonas pyrrhocoris TaxID=157538 RepID=A0A0N0VH70_LEPPY|nr:hypothetical protein ABB37_01293 [Leptomonas pyrrhocoris]KPA84814.1 hypothetical protein ABB37_01293 [Leptomonas pyrrhocoris]|eukprot:XP_015663253.1 hypothetical protein ABB37_01293 [Leptomonas pyrrhocoris]
MAALPSTAEELYELVCTLQREQQCTQLELRAIQRRSEGLKEAIQEHHDTVLAERRKRQDVSQQLAALRLTARRLKAQEEGAVCAAQSAVSALHAEQEELLQTCRRRALDGIANSSGAQHVNDIQESNGGSAADFSSRKEHRIEETGDGPAGSSSFMAPTYAFTSAVCSGKCTSMYSGAAIHALMSSLRAKLTDCLHAAATSHASCVSSTTQNSGGAAVELPEEQPRQSSQEALKEGSIPLPTSAADDPCARNGSDDALCSASAAGPNCTPSLPSTSAPPTLTIKKHIEFAPTGSFHRVTPVPAANANRLTPCFNRGESSCPSATRRTSDSRGGFGPIPIASGVNAGARKFTVRVASRSSTLLAEAAALGAKRRRTIQLTTATPSKTATNAADSGRSNSLLNPPRQSAADPRTDDVCNPPPPPHPNAALFPPDAAATSSTEQQGSDTTRIAASAGLSVCGSRVCISGNSRPRRTVWTWTRDAAQERPCCDS